MGIVHFGEGDSGLTESGSRIISSPTLTMPIHISEALEEKIFHANSLDFVVGNC